MDSKFTEDRLNQVVSKHRKPLMGTDNSNQAKLDRVMAVLESLCCDFEKLIDKVNLLETSAGLAKAQSAPMRKK